MNDFAGGIQGLITGIGHGTVRDGPGWRSIVYFKGCDFRCAWCGSPETLRSVPEILFYPERVKYQECLAASCAQGAFSQQQDTWILDRTRCAACDTPTCARVSVDGAVESIGRTITVEQAIREILPYRRMYARYGVTLSGGEATMQWDFCVALLKALRHHGIHTAIETNGNNPRLPEIFPLIDFLICDIKHPDPDSHRRWTGRGNATILENIRAAAAANVTLLVRIPIVPGVNDGDTLLAAANLLLPHKAWLTVEPLGYHRLGVYKWNALGQSYSLEHIEPPDARALESARQILRDAGLRVITT